jgi:hypothetical protein
LEWLMSAGCLRLFGLAALGVIAVIWLAATLL